MEWKKDFFTVSDDIKKLDTEAVFQFLTNSYWARGRSKETIEQSIKNSFCLGLYKDEQQIGLARVITDYVTFAYLCDVYIIEEFQRKGLGHFLMECLFLHPQMQAMKWVLKTTSAQTLYKDFEFKDLDSSFGWMSRK